MKSLLKTGVKKIMLLIAFSTFIIVVYGQGQPKFTIKGQLTDQKSMQPVSFATVALRRSSDSVLTTGVASDLDGRFIIGPVNEDNYQLVISAIGYLPENRDIKLINDFDAGTIYLQEKSVQLNEIVISSERKKAEAGMDKITYFINKKMLDASNNGADLIGFIPGVQVDMMKNISIGGSQNIIILVDGKEREKNFLSQLDPARIDKVEVTNAPDSRYDAGVTGVINIILKKEKQSGISGHIFAEAPVSSEIYLSPTYSLNYGFRKFNLYTSYNGELTYLDILEQNRRTTNDYSRTTEIITEQDVRQKYWSHRFHYGFDYFLNEKNQINFYAYYNPFSRELDGTTQLNVSGENIEGEITPGKKDDTDNNSSAFYSIYYKHSFEKPGKQIEFDLSNYNFSAENSTTFSYETGDQIINKVMPRQNTSIFKVDYTSPFTERLRLNAGIKTRLQSMHDNQQESFSYNEDIFAAYASVTYNVSKLTLSTGMRAEKSVSELEDSFCNNVVALLPDATINYKLTAKQNMKLFYNRTVDRPGLYELNPYTSYDDPFAVRSGNPYLEPEFRQNLSLSYSNSFGNNFISFELYYRNRTDAINNYSFVNDTSVFETRVDNLGNIHAYGIQVTGALKVLKIISVNPYLNLFYLNTEGNSLASQYNIDNRHKIVFQSGISAIASFRHEITASLNFQYNSPNMQIQEINFSDALYFIGLEKGFLNKCKFGIKTALLFRRTFAYHGTEVEGVNFYSHSEGNIQLSGFPVWFNFRYQFNSGKKINKIDRVKENIDNKQKKGF
jgi:hypothetical protein